jgi:electron transport complex protein RnfB
MITALAIMALGAIVLGAALGYASIKFKVEGDPLVEKIEAILPQTQCGQCGYPGCKPYAKAIAAGEADINLCPPGGMDGVRKLADLLGREVKPLDAEEKPKQVAIIDEETCIGCTLCIQACPVDAIVGAAKQMHTIIEPLCTGCELCVKPCPVECIDMQPIAENLDNWKWKYPVIEIKRAACGLRRPSPSFPAAGRMPECCSDCSSSRAASNRRPTRRLRCRSRSARRRCRRA